MQTIIKVGNSYNFPVKEFICDTEADFNILKEKETAPSGSKVYIIDKKITMIKGTSDWIKESSSEGGTGENYPWAHSEEGF